jgi:hypothetical protein
MYNIDFVFPQHVWEESHDFRSRGSVLLQKTQYLVLLRLRLS